MNAVNPTLRTRYYKELTRRRKRMNGDVDNVNDDIDLVDDAFDSPPGENSNEAPINSTTKTFTGVVRREPSSNGVDNVAVPSSLGVIAGVGGGVGFRELPAGKIVEKTEIGASSYSPSPSPYSGSTTTTTMMMSHHRAMNEDSYDDSVVGLAALGVENGGPAAGGVFLGGDAFNGMDLDAVAESGTGTKMYTPAQKKAIVEYAVQYGERAAAKKFGVHRKNIYR